MGTIREKTILSELNVGEAMRRQLVKLMPDADLDRAIHHLIKYKVNALLITDAEDAPLGVLSKTDIMGAYYAGLPIETPVSEIMISPPLFCRADHSLETALGQMRESGIYRLYVKDDADAHQGVIAYPDIVGLLYALCRECPHSRWQRAKRSESGDSALRFRVREVMTPSVMAVAASDSLESVMEGLSAYRIGALLIRDDAGNPAGVVSKTDLVLAFRHHLPTDTPADRIMSAPVRTVHPEDYLESAIQTLIFSQVHRIFVQDGERGDLAGVLSLSDAARVRSGSCQACISSRIKVEDPA